jgi:hypothetical protein
VQCGGAGGKGPFLLRIRKVHGSNLVSNIGFLRFIVLFLISQERWSNNQSVLFREIITVYSEDHTKYTTTACAKNSEYFNVKKCGIYIYILTNVIHRVRSLFWRKELITNKFL